MKNILKISALFLMGAAGACLSAYAEEPAPNRVLVVNPKGEYKSFVIDYTDQVKFMTIPGRVGVDVELFEIGLDFMTVSFIRTEACYTYELAILPAAVAAEIDDISMLSFVPLDGSGILNEDFITIPGTDQIATVSQIELEAGQDYTIAVVCYDTWGIAAGVERYDFTVPENAPSLNKPARKFVLPETGNSQLKLIKK
ncbi:MAG: hypothetical protein J1E95_09440 [Muribaculaceae bacterium]|nr:hypothetical protein [Muribaculaceae bacterium]